MTAQSKAKLVPFVRRIRPGEGLADEALLAACAAGDPGALAELYDRYCSDVCRFLSRLAYVDANEAEDLVQEVFLAVFRNARRYRSGCSTRTWLFAVAANIARGRARAAVRRRIFRARLAADPLVRSERTPDAEAMNRELLVRLQETFLELPHDLRVAFAMCDVEEIPGVEAARALHIPPGTLYRRLHEARKALRAALEGGWP